MLDSSCKKRRKARTLHASFGTRSSCFCKRIIGSSIRNISSILKSKQSNWRSTCWCWWELLRAVTVYEIVFFLPKSWSTLYVCLVSVTERAKLSTTKRQRLNSVLKVVREIINICTATRFFVSSTDVPMLNLT